VVHAVSASYLRSERMSPPAAGMALALHLTAALALWWVSPLKFTEADPEPIEVTMEAPPPPKPARPEPPAVTPPAVPAAPPAAVVPPPPSPPRAAEPVTRQGPLGLRPPGPPQQADAPPKTVEPAPAPAPAPEPPPEPPPVDKVLPKVEAPAPPLTMQDFVRIAPPPAPREVVKPLPQQVAPAPPQQALRPSPLSPHAQQASRSDGRGASATFVNPADAYDNARKEETYLWQIAAKIAQYRYYSNQEQEQRPIALRLAIARDGRLVDAAIERSSGSIAIDKGLLEATRAASPYPPLPADIDGNPHVFILSLTPQYRR